MIEDGEIVGIETGVGSYPGIKIMSQNIWILEQMTELGKPWMVGAGREKALINIHQGTKARGFKVMTMGQAIIGGKEEVRSS